FSFFFFSSRRRHTRSDRDWSSDVCSSDLMGMLRPASKHMRRHADSSASSLPGIWSAWSVVRCTRMPQLTSLPMACGTTKPRVARSEERRVGKECRSWWSQYSEEEDGVEIG